MPTGDNLLSLCIDTEINESDFKLESLLKILLDEGTNPDIFDINGDTPLMYSFKR